MTSLVAALCEPLARRLPYSAPSPASGGGVGRGNTRTNLVACPLPVPPPQAGEGTLGLQSLFNRKSVCP
jgi:hypothetical protein